MSIDCDEKIQFWALLPRGILMVKSTSGQHLASYGINPTLMGLDRRARIPEFWHVHTAKEHVPSLTVGQAALLVLWIKITVDEVYLNFKGIQPYETVNHDPEIWCGTEPHKFPSGPRDSEPSFIITVISSSGIWTIT